MIPREQIEAQIAQLEAQLAAYIEEANRQIAAQQGGIAALRLLLVEPAGDAVTVDEM